MIPALDDNSKALAQIAAEQNKMATASDNLPAESLFLPRLQLLHAQSKVRTDWDKERGPKPEEGNFWMGPPGDVFLGKQFVGVPLSWRDHALRTKGNEVLLESYNAPKLGEMPKTPEESAFLEIKAASATKSKQPKDQQDRVGKDVLIWVPNQQQADMRWPGMPGGLIGKFAIYFIAGTAVPEADNFRLHFFKKVTVRAKEVNGRSFTWYVPEVDLYERVGVMRPEEVPNFEQTKLEIAKFVCPTAKGENTPKAAAAGVDGAAR